MNRNDIIKFLSILLGDFIFHSALLTEIAADIAKSGYETKFFNILLARLKFLSEHGIDAPRLHHEFEVLANADGLCSMHISSKGFNYRILYSFSPEQKAILLLGFYKRDGHNKTDYTPHIPPAQQRLAELMKEQ